MSLSDTALELAAVSSADDAAKAARAAQNAAEERLESGNNPFINLTILRMESVKQPGFFSRSKAKVGGTHARMSVKRTDISHLIEVSDDFGTTYTRAFLEMRSNLYESQYSQSDDNDDAYIVLAGTLEDNQKLVNG